MLTRRILGVEVVDDRETGKYCLKPAERVSFIQTWKPKSNYNVPRFHFYESGFLTSLLTLETCKAALIDYQLLAVGKYLVNPRQVKDVSRRGLTKFGGAAKEILLPRDKSQLALNLGQSLGPIVDDLEIIAVKYNDDYDENEIEFGWFSLKDLCYIDIYEVKSNYKVPRFHTTNGIFTVILTISACQQIFQGFRKMDSGLLVNFDYVDYARENERGVLEIHFTDRTKVEIAEARRSMVSNIMRNDLVF